MAFCDYCSCLDCREGTNYLSHAQTSDGFFICDVCYSYDLCTSGTNRASDPCKDHNCSHRPKIVSEWIKFKK